MKTWNEMFESRAEVGVRCPECRIISAAGEWTKTNTECDSCGDHDAIECPACLHVFDYVWNREDLGKVNP